MTADTLQSRAGCCDEFHYVDDDDDGDDVYVYVNQSLTATRTDHAFCVSHHHHRSVISNDDASSKQTMNYCIIIIRAVKLTH